MNASTDLLEAAVGLVLELLLAASWHGGVAIALAWLACRLWRGMPPGVRPWLWRLAYLKMLLALIWLPELRQPLVSLPEEKRASVQSALGTAVQPATATHPIASAASRAGATPRTTEGARAHQAESHGAPPIRIGSRLRPSGREAPLVESEWRRASRSVWESHGAPGLVLIWLVGAACFLGSGLLGVRGAMRLQRNTLSLVDEEPIQECASVAAALGVEPVPELRRSNLISGPVLTGLWKPVVLMPADALYSRDDLRMVLAHELAHVKRRDFWWDCLPIVARALFFFHPLVWLAEREWCFAREAACDDLTLRATGSAPAAYGSLLMRLATHEGTRLGVVATGMASSFDTLRRRLRHLNSAGPVSCYARLGLVAAVAGLGAAVALPWRPGVQAAAAPSTSAATAKAPPVRTPDPLLFRLGPVDRELLEPGMYPWLVVNANISAAQQDRMLSLLRARKLAAPTLLSKAPAERMAFLETLVKDLKAQLTEAQVRRLDQINVQQLRYAPLFGARGPGPLGLTEVQKKQAQEFQAYIGAERPSHEGMTRGNAAARNWFDRREQRLWEGLRALLTADQRTRFDALVGKRVTSTMAFWPTPQEVRAATAKARALWLRAALRGETPGDPTTAERNLKTLFQMREIYRRRHGGAEPVSYLLTSEFSSDWFAYPVFSSDFRDAGVMDRDTRLRPFIGFSYETSMERPDGTPVGGPKRPGERDVLASTSIYFNDMMVPNGAGRYPIGFHLVLWDDGTVERVSWKDRVLVPMRERPRSWRYAFKGQAGVGPEAISYERFHRDQIARGRRVIARLRKGDPGLY